MSHTEPVTVGSAAGPPAPPARRRHWPYWLAGFVLVTAGYVALAVSLGSKTPGDATVGGVDVGGLSRSAAAAKLAEAVAARGAADVAIALGDERATIDPGEAGLEIDIGGTLDGLTGFTLNPLDVLAKVTGEATRDLAITADDARLTAALTAATTAVNQSPKDATLAFDEGASTITPGVDGITVDVAETADAVKEAWPAADPIIGVVRIAEPDVTDEEAAAAKTAYADKILSGPVTVRVGGEASFEVDPKALTDSITFAAGGGALAPEYDAKGLVAAVRAAGTKADVLTEGKDAEVTSVNGRFRVSPSRDGLDVEGASTVAGIKAALLSTERIAAVKAKAVPAEFTTSEAKASIPTGVISTFTTYFPDNPDRTHNIRLAVAALNGAYVAPGEQFSLNARLGQRTAARGYRSAPVIVNGRLTMDYGGGISQVSTTLFNAVFFSGAQIDEFLPHSFYISRYPEGREATISWPNVDQKFTNTTNGGIYITASTGANSITVSFSGRKTWDVEAVKGPRVNIVEPKTIRDDSEDCVPQTPAEGFDVTVARIFLQKGKEVKRSSFTTHYIPEDLVICTKT